MMPIYNTSIFSEVFEDDNDFRTQLNNTAFANCINYNNQNILYALLMARYANNPIANMDINQFKNKLFSIIWQYGPAWEKKLDIQNKLRNLTEDEISTGTKAIYNNAYNPGTEPGTGYLGELTAINEQRTTNYKKSKMDGYMQLWDLLENDVSNEFLNKFRVCFKQFVSPEAPLLYAYEEEL